MSEPKEVRYIRASEVAKLLSVHINTLRRWRIKGEGPPFHIIGHYPRYILDEVMEFKSAARVAGSTFTQTSRSKVNWDRVTTAVDVELTPAQERAAAAAERNRIREHGCRPCQLGEHDDCVSVECACAVDGHE